MRITFTMNHLDKLPICEHGLAQGFCSRCDNWKLTGVNRRILEVMQEAAIGSNDQNSPSNQDRK